MKWQTLAGLQFAPGRRRDATPSWSQEGEDMVLRRLLESRPRGPGFYVDVGAHHPTRFSNTCHWSRAGWRGINIEPNPEVQAAFARQQPRDINLCVGVSDSPGTLRYSMLDDPALNTFDETLAARHAATGRWKIVRTVEVPVRRLDAILAEYLPAGTAIDFLSIDVEGLDLQVLRSNEWQRWRPRHVLAEDHTLALDALETSALHSLMPGLGYRLVAKTVCTVFYADVRPSSPA